LHFSGDPILNTSGVVGQISLAAAIRAHSSCFKLELLAERFSKFPCTTASLSCHLKK